MTHERTVAALRMNPVHGPACGRGGETRGVACVHTTRRHSGSRFRKWLVTSLMYAQVAARWPRIGRAGSFGCTPARPAPPLKPRNGCAVRTRACMDPWHPAPPAGGVDRRGLGSRCQGECLQMHPPMSLFRRVPLTALPHHACSHCRNPPHTRRKVPLRYRETVRRNRLEQLRTATPRAALAECPDVGKLRKTYLQGQGKLAVLTCARRRT